MEVDVQKEKKIFCNKPSPKSELLDGAGEVIADLIILMIFFSNVVHHMRLKHKDKADNYYET
ncbi:hypothetical protein DWB63_03255 [Pseudodesulfovibrio sp. S3]|nr:hypothetical protein DWB63_03255 [Pseudodesulfovibrio sp. S3]